jgi:replication factor C subunit 1
VSCSFHNVVWFYADIYLFIQGAPNCFSGLTIIVTGVLDSLFRDEAEKLVEKYGGKATKSISKKTSYVLAGEDAGPAKLAKVCQIL